MKIITKCIIDMRTLQVIEEESYDYIGPVTECKGGGGGSSGHVSHSAYLEAVHGDWLNATGVDLIEKSVTEVMDSALGSSPWTALTAYNPDADIAAYAAVIAAFKAILSGMSDTADWAALYAQADASITGVTDAEIAADVDAFADQLDDEILTKVLPRFRRGMQDINAVVSSAFPIGEAIIEGFRDRDVAKYSSAIRLAMMGKKSDLLISGTGQMLQLMLQRIGWEGDYAKMFTEAMRIKIVAKKEQTDQDATIDEADAKWDLEVFQYGANVLAAIGGGTAMSTSKGASKAQSAIGGALTGAAAGMLLGTNPAVAAATGGLSIPIGAVLGMASGLL